MGTDVCGFFSSQSVVKNKRVIFLESGVQLKSEVSSYAVTCAICMCTGGERDQVVLIIHATSKLFSADAGTITVSTVPPRELLLVQEHQQCHI